jgi:dihydrofolate synthase / folylpolyglutamate synthase
VGSLPEDIKIPRMLACMHTREEALQYIYSLPRPQKRPTLARIEQVLHALGDPHKTFKSIHITGSVGKGSTASFCATTLQHAGHRVGLYTSPHLASFNERIQLNGVPIADADLVTLITRVRDTLEHLQLPGHYHEVLTAVGFLYFAQMHVDIAVVEVGMGGRYDATNVITPLVSVITNISLEHAHIIGPTLMDVAKEKAGIIKEGVPVVSAEKDPGLQAYFRNVCAAHHTTLTLVHEACVVSDFKEGLFTQTFTVTGAVEGTFRMQMGGEHQVTNALTALLALRHAKPLHLTTAQLQEGVLTTHWPGRLHVVSTNPLVILDGAHNEHGMQALTTFVRTLPKQKIVVFALSEGRDPHTIIPSINTWAARVIITKGNFKPQDPATLAPLFTVPVHIIPDPVAACKTALELCTTEMIVITGSLYLVGDVLAHPELFSQLNI